MTYQERAYFEREPVAHVAAWAEARKADRRRAEVGAAMQERRKVARRAVWSAIH